LWPSLFVPLKTTLQGEREGRDVALGRASPLTQIPRAGRDQGPGGDLRSVAGGSVFPRFPRLLLLLLAPRGRDRAAARGDADTLRRVTFPGLWAFLGGDVGQPKIIRLHLPICTAPPSHKEFLGSCFLGAGELCWRDKPRHTAPKPFAALPGSLLGWPWEPKQPGGPAHADTAGKRAAATAHLQ